MNGETLCTKCRNPECEYAGRKVWVMICAHEYVAPPMTNADRFRAKPDDELATILAEAECPSDLGGKDKCKNGTTDFSICRECWLDWLRQKAE